MTIGQRLKEARLMRKMTQPELAAAVGVTKGAIGNYETDISSPKEPILIKLMDVLQIDANYLYQDYIDSPPQLTSDENHLLTVYRGANDQAKSDSEGHRFESCRAYTAGSLENKGFRLFFFPFFLVVVMWILAGFCRFW